MIAAVACGGDDPTATAPAPTNTPTGQQPTSEPATPTTAAPTSTPGSGNGGSVTPPSPQSKAGTAVITTNAQNYAEN